MLIIQAARAKPQTALHHPQNPNINTREGKEHLGIAANFQLCSK
jgi:hypothetical protein